MVTILPIDIDQDLIREGLQYAVAERFTSTMHAASELIAQLRGGNLVGREEWEKAFADIAEMYRVTLPVLDFAESLDDTDYTSEASDDATPS
jgi:hypothetical protein